MKGIILSFVILLFAPNAFAQKHLFKTHRSYCSESFNIDLTKPKEFKVTDGLTQFRINEKMNIGTLYQMVLESKSKDCLILFPCFDKFPSHSSAAKYMVYGEVKAALNLNSDHGMRMNLVNNKFVIQGALNSNLDSPKVVLDTAKYVKIIAKDNMEDYFNADTVYIFKVRRPQPYKEIYYECVGINAIKKGFPSAIMKILLTKEGKKKEEEYIQLLFKNIHYGNTIPEYSQDK